MFAKGRAKWTYGQMPSLLEQMYICPLGERSDPGKLKVFRGSVRDLPPLALQCETGIEKE